MTRLKKLAVILVLPFPWMFAYWYLGFSLEMKNGWTHYCWESLGWLPIELCPPPPDSSTWLMVMFWLGAIGLGAGTVWVAAPSRKDSS